MARVKLIANRDLSYASRALKAGDSFEADNEQDANVLVLVGHARREEERDKRTYRRRDLRAEH